MPDIGQQDLGADTQNDPDVLQGSNSSWHHICNRDTVGLNEDCLGKIGAGPLTKSCMCFDHRVYKKNSNKSAGDVLEPATTSEDG